MTTLHRDRPLADVISDVFHQLVNVVRNEVQLARTEMGEKLGKLAGSFTFVGIGAVLLLPALVILLQAAVSALQRLNLPPDLAALIVGGVVLIVGIVLVMSGIKRVKAAIDIVPEKALHQLQLDANVATFRRTENDKRAA